MLLNLHIKNMALIDEMDIDFGGNLNILTGETGAGKSIVIDSIMLALGGKTPKDFVRKDAEYGLVELLFSIEDKETRKRLEELEVPDTEDGELVLSRKIIGNRSVSKVNGETVTLSRIREISSLLLDLHAQHEHQSLLVMANHLKLLDRYGQEKLTAKREKVSAVFEEYTAIKSELAENTMNEEEKKRQLDLLEFEQNEIKRAALKPGEDEELEKQYHLAVNSKRIAEGLSRAYSYTEDTAYDAVDRAVREVSGISEYAEELQEMCGTLETVSELLADFGRSSREYLEKSSFSDEEFAELENRLNTVNHLKAKYGKTIPEVQEYGRKLEEKLERLIHQEAYAAGLKEKLAVKEKELESACSALTEARKQVAKELSRRITEALVDLNFLDVRFDMVFEPTPQFTASGRDNAYFIISTNIGEEMKPLSQVASGGELSRIMLAMKSCLADADRIETMIFDEIDVGISGRTAQMVAEKIYKIGGNHQIICITHLPQIAAMANQHYRIEKVVDSGKTVTRIYRLGEKEEILELARLIGGVKITDTVMQSAKEMKELAGKAKVN
ncbi:MAG: DNA repair protein RecN [Bacteroidales bacterium]|nr:DNA repair protein RecN [Clostridium sp.]MCM1202646.1 DNA repair protein RecN [Bacteroidales bacterium]